MENRYKDIKTPRIFYTEYLKNKFRKIRHIIVIPILSTLIIPIVIMDIWVEIYHRICFPLSKIPYVKRKNYIKIDRYKLKYLSFAQKIYCIYCGYANGLAGYWVKIGGETEKYWCGIKHKQDLGFKEPEHHKNFVEFGDESEFNRRYKN